MKMRDRTPEAIFIETAFGKNAMNVRIPFQVAAKGMKDTDKSRNKVSFMIKIIEKTGDSLIDSLKKTVQKRTVSKKKWAKFFRYGEYTVPVCGANQFE